MAAPDPNDMSMTDDEFVHQVNASDLTDQQKADLVQQHAQAQQTQLDKGKSTTPVYKYTPPGKDITGPLPPLPARVNRQAMIGNTIGEALGRFGSGYLQGREAKREADQVAAKTKAAVASTQEASRGQALKDRMAEDKTTSSNQNPPSQPSAPQVYVYSPNDGSTAHVGTVADSGDIVPEREPGQPIQESDDQSADATSDVRSKTSKRDARGMLDKVKAYSYEYKDDEQGPEAPPGRHYGVMAQDLERSPVGRSMVDTDPKSGRKTVNYGQGLGAMMAGLADAHDRLKSLETARRKK